MSTRITIRLDDALYDRLLLFAQGRSQGQVPEVSTIVREALELYLRPRSRQTSVSHERGKTVISQAYRGDKV